LKYWLKNVFFFRALSENQYSHIQASIKDDKDQVRTIEEEKMFCSYIFFYNIKLDVIFYYYDYYCAGRQE
jgi:hypothetical protein